MFNEYLKIKIFQLIVRLAILLIIFIIYISGTWERFLEMIGGSIL